MKNLVLVAFCLAGISVPAWGQTYLELINPLTNTSVVTVVAGGTFSLNIDIQAINTTPAPLDAFDLTFSSAPGTSSPQPTGLTLSSYSNEVSNFFGGSAGSGNPPEYGAVAGSPSDDVAFTSTPTTILTANFTTSPSLTPGTYTIDFPPAGSPNFQNLFSYGGGGSNPDVPITPYTAVDATIYVLAVPEPPLFGFLLLGLAILGFSSSKRRLVESR